MRKYLKKTKIARNCYDFDNLIDYIKTLISFKLDFLNILNEYSKMFKKF